MHRLLWCLLLLPAACGRSSSSAAPAHAPVKPAPSAPAQPTFQSFSEEFRPRRSTIEGPIRRGPYVQAVGTTEATICFETVNPMEGKVECEGRTSSSPRGVRHEIAIRGLKPGTRYNFTIQPGGASGSFKAALDGDGT